MVRALILAPFSRRHLDRLRRSVDVSYESWLDTRRLYDPDQLASRLRKEDMAILVVESDFVFEDLFQQATGLRFVGVCRNSTGHIDVEAATRHGVVVVNTPARNAQAVAEHTLGLMLALARGIPAAHQYVGEGRWEDPVEPYISMRGVELGGRTLGIVGLGAIGKRLAEFGLALGMKVMALDPYAKRVRRRITLVDKGHLMAQSDFIAIHVPLTPETEGLLDAEDLALMKPTAYLVNASDAAVVVQEALVEALRHRRMAGAAFDVFDSHPVSPRSPLLALDNVVLSPHLGGATVETIERHSQTMADDILLFLEGRPPEHMVNPPMNPRAWRQNG